MFGNGVGALDWGGLLKRVTGGMESNWEKPSAVGADAAFVMQL